MSLIKYGITLALSFISVTMLCAQTQSRREGAVLPQPAAVEQYDVGGGPVSFAFTHKEGDNYRTLSSISEDIFINGRPDSHVEILNRIALHVTGVSEDGTGSIEGTFMTSENSTGSLAGSRFSWGNEYTSTFERTKLGLYTISDEYFMPTIRDVPVFPDHPVAPGESWTAEGYEAHDFRQNFNIPEPYKVPFIAKYTYLGTINRDATDTKSSGSKKLHVISVSYKLYTDTPAPARTPGWRNFPETILGSSDRLIYWDAERGAMDHYSENFLVRMYTFSGTRIDFIGTSQSEITEFTRTATEENVERIQQKVEELGLENVTVSKGEKGLTLSIENIQFKSDSAELMQSEKEKIKRIVKILEAYPNDILVTGHTARATGGPNPQVLSEQRAQAVADYLIQLGVRDQYHIFTQGFGDSRPAFPNTTREGRAKNRRVEITIMDN